ncbi:MAG TPA: BON domain-containing protein [Terriglobales bacterium]|nr:BON domain-containing protein [Terriglobales bacterium]
MSNPEIRDAIRNKMSTEPVLAKSNLTAAVDDKTVVLSGTVATKRQRRVALRIARSCAGDRTIVDKIAVSVK